MPYLLDEFADGEYWTGYVLIPKNSCLQTAYDRTGGKPTKCEIYASKKSKRNKVFIYTEDKGVIEVNIDTTLLPQSITKLDPKVSKLLYNR